MTQRCHPIPRDVAQTILGTAARSLCDRPGQDAAEREAQTRLMIHTVLGMEPRDGLELMLAIAVFGQFTLLLDTMRDIHLGQEDAARVRAKAGISGLTRSLIGLLGEFRRARARPVADRPEAAPEPETAAPPPAAEPSPWTEDDEARLHTRLAGLRAALMGDAAAPGAEARDQTDAPPGDGLGDLFSVLAAMAAEGVAVPGG